MPKYALRLIDADDTEVGKMSLPPDWDTLTEEEAKQQVPQILSALLATVRKDLDAGLAPVSESEFVKRMDAANVALYVQRSDGFWDEIDRRQIDFKQEMPS